MRRLFPSVVPMIEALFALDALGPRSPTSPSGVGSSAHSTRSDIGSGKAFAVPASLPAFGTLLTQLRSLLPTTRSYIAPDTSTDARGAWVVLEDSLKPLLDIHTSSACTDLQTSQSQG